MRQFKTFLSSILLFASISSALARPAHITSFADIIEPLMPTVVNVYTVTYNNPDNVQGVSLTEVLPSESINSFFNKFNIPVSFDNLYNASSALALGSGFIVDANGYIITNYHVVAGSDEIYVKLYNGEEWSAQIVGTDPKTDLALLKIEPQTKLPVVEFADSFKSRVGDIVIAIGNPLGFGGTVTTGIISSKGRDLGVNKDELVDDFIQTDAAINTGNSGGPLFNIDGQVIGLNTAIADVGTGANIGIGFAIPSETVQDIMKRLQAKGKINRGRLNISIQEVTEELSKALNLNNAHGVLIVDVTPGGAGDQAGLKRGDLITEFNDQIVLNSRKLEILVADSQINEKVKLTILRDNNSINLTVKVVEFDYQQQKNTISNETILQKSGIMFGDLSPSLITKLGLNEQSKGIVVVELASKDMMSDLKVGDVVMEIDQQPVINTEQFNEIYEKSKNSKKQNVVLLVKRKNSTMFVVLPVK